MDKAKVTIITGSAALAYFILATSFYLPYYNDGFFKQNFLNNGAYDKLGKENADEIYWGMREYLDDAYFGYERTHLISDFSEKEQAHLTDVKKVIDWVCILYYLAIFLLVASAAATCRWLGNDWKDIVAGTLHYGGAAAFAFIAIVGLFSLINFDLLWRLFHAVLFPQGNWQFSANSLLITFFPEKFFQEFVNKFSSLAVLISVTVSATGWYLKKEFTR